MTPTDLIHLPHLTACGTILGYLHQLLGRGVSVSILNEPGFVRFSFNGAVVDRLADTFLVNDDRLRVIAVGIASQLKNDEGNG